MPIPLVHTWLDDPLKQEQVQQNFDVIAIGAVGDSEASYGLSIPSYVNSWRQYGGTDNDWTPAGYWKGPDGVVHFEGLIDKAGGNWIANDTIFTLPAGFRPRTSGIWTVACHGTSAADAELRVLQSGVVAIGTRGGIDNPVNCLALAGVSFKAA